MEPLAVLVRALERSGVRPGDRLGVACSGGADSTALLLLLAEHGALDLHVLHVDHGLRPDAAEDARAVRELAAELALPCSVLAVTVEARARTSLEARARQARYAALERAAAEFGLAWIATGHTRDDQAETVLLRILRGTGIAGLAGIAPVRGRIVRPLLEAGRDELRSLLREGGVSWREDPTNAELDADRNWVRHVVLPLLAGRREGVGGTLARLARLARADDAFLEELAGEALGPTGEGWALLRDVDAPRPILSRAVRGALEALDRPGGEAAVERVLGLVDASVGGKVGCAHEVEAYRLAEGVVLVRRDLDPPAPVPLPEGTTVAAGFGVRVRVGREPSAPPGTWRIACRAEGLVLRSRRPGDRLATSSGTKKVQDVLVDAKVPRALRDRVPVLADAGGPVALVGWTLPPVGSSPGAADADAVVDVDPLQGHLWEATGLWTTAKLRATS